MFTGKGYQGKFLRVNLSTGEIQQEFLPENLVRKFLGGDGFLMYYLYNELKPKINPLSPENKKTGIPTTRKLKGLELV